MSFLSTIILSSVGKKVINAVAGLGLCIFITIHLAGNIPLLTGKAETFNSYSHFLENTGALLYISEGGLVLFFLLHILTGTAVWWSKQTARPESYKKSVSAGSPSKKTISSMTMIYTGVILLIFTVIHLKTLKYGPGIAEGYFVEIDGVIMRDLFRLTMEVFSKPVYVIWYVVTMVLLGYHLRHGFWSAFQSLGALHPKFRPLVYGIGVTFAIVIAVGFIVLPVKLYFRGGVA